MKISKYEPGHLTRSMKRVRRCMHQYSCYSNTHQRNTWQTHYVNDLSGTRSNEDKKAVSKNSM